MNCRETRLSLGSYLDEELDPSSETLLSRHLESCEPCRTLFERERDLEGEIGRVLKIHPVSKVWDDLPARLATPTRRGFVLPALVASLLAAFGVGYVLWPYAGPKSLAEITLGCHEHALRGEGGPDVYAKTVSLSSALTERLGMPVTISDASPGPIIVAARTCKLRGRRIGHVFAEGEGVPITVLVLDRRLLGDLPAQELQGEVKGHAFRACIKGNMVVSAVGRVSPETLTAILDRFRPERP